MIGYKYTKGLFNNFEKFEVNDVPSIQYPAVVYGHFSILIWGHNQWTCRLGTRSIPRCPISLPSTIKLAYNSRVYSIPPPNLIFCVWRVSNRTLFYPKFSPKSIQRVGQAKESSNVDSFLYFYWINGSDMNCYPLILTQKYDGHLYIPILAPVQ